MTIEERLSIISKEALTVEDIAKLFNVSKSSAGEIMRSIKAQSDRLKISTVVHLQDYIDVFKLPPDRFIIDQEWKTYLRQIAKAKFDDSKGTSQ